MGRLIAVCGDRKLHYSRTEDGVDYGYIVSDDRRHPDKPLISLLSRGYWEAVPESDTWADLATTLDEIRRAMKEGNQP